MVALGHAVRLLGYHLKKWLWCSWLHWKERCYPEVWKVDSNLWHCTRCHSCGEGLEEYFASLETKGRALTADAAHKPD